MQITGLFSLTQKQEAENGGEGRHDEQPMAWPMIFLFMLGQFV